MKRTLDFNAIEQPTLELIFRDAARTTVNVTTPTTALIEKLTANRATINEALAGKDDGTIAQVYDLMGELISCNKEGLVVTGDDLLHKYGWDNLAYPLYFYAEYLGMVENIKTAKN